MPKNWPEMTRACGTGVRWRRLALGSTGSACRILVVRSLEVDNHVDRFRTTVVNLDGVVRAEWHRARVRNRGPGGVVHNRCVRLRASAGIDDEVAAGRRLRCGDVHLGS